MAEEYKESIDIEVKNKEANNALKETAKEMANVGEKAEEAGKKTDKAMDNVADSVKQTENAMKQAGNTAVKEAKKSEEANKKATKQSKKMAEAAKSLRQELTEETQALASLTMKFEALTDEQKRGDIGKTMLRQIDMVRNSAGGLRDALDDAKEAIKNTASDSSSFDAISQGLNLAASAAGAYAGALGLVGVSEEEQQDIQTKLQASLAISNALTVAQNALQKQSALMQGVKRVQDLAAAAAINVKTAAEGKNIVVTKAATLAQAAFNKVAAANPYVLLAVAILSVVGAMTAFTLATKKNVAEQKQANKELDLQKQYYDQLGTSLSSDMATFRGLQNAWKRLSSESAKTKWLKENASAFEKLGLKVKDVKDAEELLVKNSAKVVEAFRLRAQAMAAQNAQVKAYENYYKNIYENQRKNVQKANANNITEEERKAIGQKMTIVNMSTSAGVIQKRTYDNTDAINEKVTELRKQRAITKMRKNRADAERILKEQLDMFDKVQEDANTKLADFDFLGKNEKEDTKKDNTADKIKQLGKQIADAQYQAALRTKEAKVKAYEDGEKKVLEQLEIEHTKEVVALQNEMKDYLDKQKELAKLKGQKYNEASDPTMSSFAKRLEYLQNLYDKSVEQIKQNAATAMNEYLAENGSYAEQVNAIIALFQEKMKNATGAEKLGLLSQMEEQLESLRNNFAEGINELSGDALQSMLDMLNKIKEANSGAFDEQTLRAYDEQIQAITKKLGNKNPFKELKDSRDELAAAIAARKSAQSNYANAEGDLLQASAALDLVRNTATKDGTGAVDAKSKGKIADAENKLAQARTKAAAASKVLNQALTREAKAEQKVVSDTKSVLKVYDALFDVIDSIGDACSDNVKQMLSIVTTIGTTVTSAIAGMTAAAEAGSEAIKTVERASVILAIISAAIQIATQIVNMFTAAHDEAAQDKIDRIQEKVDALKDAYEELEEQVEQTFSKAKTATIEKEMDNLRQQIKLINQQIKLEESKKKSDSSTINSWKDEIKSLEKELKSLETEAQNAIYGEDIKSAIENFADAYAEAWENGSSKAKSAKNVVKTMMRQMVNEAIKSAIQASGAMEDIRLKLAEFFTDNYFSDWEQNYIKNMANDLEKRLDEQFGWADGLYKSGTDDTAGGFATASQDSVDELNGRFTAMQMNTSTIVAQMTEVNEQSKSQLEHLATIRGFVEQSVNLGMEANDYLSSIEKHTRELYTMNERIAKIEANTRNI